MAIRFWSPGCKASVISLLELPVNVSASKGDRVEGVHGRLCRCPDAHCGRARSAASRVHEGADTQMSDLRP